MRSQDRDPNKAKKIGDQLAELPRFMAVATLIATLSGCANLQTPEVVGADNSDLYIGESALVYENKTKDATVEQLNEEADLALALGETDKAVFYYVRSLGIDGSQHELYAKIAYIHMEKGNHGLAVKAFDRALKIAPEHIPSLSGLGRTHLTLKHYQKAKELLEEAAWLDQKRFEPQTFIAGTDAETADNEVNPSSQEQDVAAEADQPALPASTGEHLAVKAQPLDMAAEPESEATLEGRLKNVTPDWQVDNKSPYDVYNSLGIIADLRKEFWLAQFYYELAIQIQPQNPSPYNNVGYSYYLSEQWEEAEKRYRKALKLDANYEGAWRNLGLLYTRQGRYHKALDTFSRIMEEPEAYNTVGYLCMLSKRYEQAEQFFEKAIDLSPSYYLLARQNLKLNRQYLEQEALNKD